LKALFSQWECDYVEYNNPDDAQITYESFIKVKKFIGVPYYKKRFRRDCNITNKRALKKTGYK